MELEGAGPDEELALIAELVGEELASGTAPGAVAVLTASLELHGPAIVAALHRHGIPAHQAAVDQPPPRRSCAARSPCCAPPRPTARGSLARPPTSCAGRRSSIRRAPMRSMRRCAAVTREPCATRCGCGSGSRAASGSPRSIASSRPGPAGGARAGDRRGDRGGRAQLGGARWWPTGAGRRASRPRRPRGGERHGPARRLRRASVEPVATRAARGRHQGAARGARGAPPRG